jgi:hypothetical protein
MCSYVQFCIQYFRPLTSTATQLFGVKIITLLYSLFINKFRLHTTSSPSPQRKGLHLFFILQQTASPYVKYCLSYAHLKICMICEIMRAAANLVVCVKTTTTTNWQIGQNSRFLIFVKSSFLPFSSFS